MYQLHMDVLFILLLPNLVRNMYKCILFILRSEVKNVRTLLSKQTKDIGSCRTTTAIKFGIEKYV